MFQLDVHVHIMQQVMLGDLVCRGSPWCIALSPTSSLFLVALFSLGLLVGAVAATTTAALDDIVAGLFDDLGDMATLSVRPGAQVLHGFVGGYGAGLSSLSSIGLLSASWRLELAPFSARR